MKRISTLGTRKIMAFVLMLFIACASCLAHAEQNLISLFPLENYNQSISNWIKPEDADYDKVLLSADVQQQRMDELFRHLFGDASPWNKDYVNRILKLSAPDDLKTLEHGLLLDYSNRNKPEKEIGYGENFRPHTQVWIDAIADNVNLSQFENFEFHDNQRGIAIDNCHVRALPTNDVSFYHYKQAGQGYPFDNLQMSALWAGMPVYIIGESRDHAWMLVLTPEVIGWVKSGGIARASNQFIQQWQMSAKNKLAAITQTQTSLVDEQNQFMLTAYVGSVFPVADDTGVMQLMIPVADVDHQAVVKRAVVSAAQAAVMPFRATPHHFAMIMRTLIGRPYGWGGMYFYNDCSAEMKSLFTPFGIWLPRHSSEQITRGKMVDLSAYSQAHRLQYLNKHGRKMMTLVYIGSHIFLYLGQYPKGRSEQLAMTYQNMWGLRPRSVKSRAVIGKSVIFPLLLQYPENSALVSQADKRYFQLAFLDQLPPVSSKRKINLNRLILRALILPDFGLLNELMR